MENGAIPEKILDDKACYFMERKMWHPQWNILRHQVPMFLHDRIIEGSFCLEQNTLIDRLTVRKTAYDVIMPGLSYQMWTL
jgi:hypothetical protein